METATYSTPYRVNKVYVRGLKNTKEYVVQQELTALKDATTLGAIGDGCLSAAAALQSLGIFDGADVLVDAGPSRGGGGDEPPLADIIVTVAEKTRLTSAATGVSTQAGEGSMDAQVTVRNLFGRAERLEANMELGQQKSSTFRFGAIRPRWMGADAQLSADISKSAVSHLKHSSFIEKVLGGTVSCRFGTADGPYGAHDLSYQLSHREIDHKLARRTASWPILQQCGSSLKSGLTYTLTSSTLNHALMPTRGSAFRLSTEVAGVLPPVGNVRFCKQSMHAAAVLPVLPQGALSLSLQLTAGLLVPLGGGTAKAESAICDRFFLGGPGSFWGFRTRGVGPREVRHTATGEMGSGPPPRDTLGGDVLATATAALSAALPGKLHEVGMRAHVFASAGGLQSLSGYNSEGSFGPSVRACAGVGVAMPTAVGRVELNLTHVLRRRSEDAVVRNGLQIGITPGLV